MSTVYSYIKYIYIRTNRVCNHLCNIKTRLCGCAAHCELSPESVLPLHLRLISIISTDLYVRTGFHRVEGKLLSRFRQFTCSRRLCISGLTFALKFVCSNQRIPFSCSFVSEGCKFKKSYCALAFTMNVLYVAQGFVIASSPIPQCHSQTVHCRRTDAL